MIKATVKQNEFGKPMISYDKLLDAEPLALYVNHMSREITLSLSNGHVISLGHFASSPELSALLAMHEVTIESKYGGLLAAGYSVGIHHLDGVKV